MILGIFYGVIFFSILFFFGFFVSRKICDTKNNLLVIPTAVIIGINGYNFFVNVVSYFIPIQITVYLGLLVCLSVIFFLIKCGDQYPLDAVYESISPRKVWILCITVLVITFFSGIVALRSLALDDLLLPHIPLASTISSGNFPVLDPSSPDHLFAYHYGSDLFSAITHMITGIPIAFAYDIQIMLFTGSLFLILFWIIYESFLNYRVAFWGAILFLYGTSMQWIYLFTVGVPLLWQRYFLGIEVAAPWTFVAYAVFPKLNTSYIHSMHNHSLAMGMPVLFIALFLYFRAVRSTHLKRSWCIGLVGSIFYGYLALNLETYFVIITIAFVSFLVLYLFKNKFLYLRELFSSMGERFVPVTLLFLVLGTSIAFLQGGILTGLFRTADKDHFEFVRGLEDFSVLDLAVAPNRIVDPSIQPSPGDLIPIISFDFFIQFGLVILLSIPAIFYFRKNGKIMFFTLVACGAFAVPFLFNYPARPWEMTRFFTFAVPLFYLIGGVWLAHVYNKYNDRRCVKSLICIVILCATASGFLSQILFSVSSMDKFGKIKTPLFILPEKPSLVDQKSYQWIKSNTTITDRFFPYSVLFIRETGRFTVGVPRFMGFSQRNEERVLYQNVVEYCSVSSMKKLGINYLYVSPDFPIKNITSCNLSQNFSVAHVEEIDGESRILYKLN